MSLNLLFDRCSRAGPRLTVVIRIQEGCTPQVATALDVLHKRIKKRNRPRNVKQPQRGGARDGDIEAAIIQALAPFHITVEFKGLISQTNDYNQTLAHFAVLFGYTNLLRRLVEWKINIGISDVNGLTPLHCAYKKGDRASVELLLENGAPVTVLDALGRAPSHLMPKGFDAADDHDIEMSSYGKPGSEEPPDAISLPQNTSDHRHEVSGLDEGRPVGDSRGLFGRLLDQIDGHRPADVQHVPGQGSCPINEFQFCHSGQP